MGMLTLRVSQAFAWASGAYQKKKAVIMWYNNIQAKNNRKSNRRK
jgi:hypothetical protein